MKDARYSRRGVDDNVGEGERERRMRAYLRCLYRVVCPSVG